MYYFVSSDLMCLCSTLFEDKVFFYLITKLYSKKNHRVSKGSYQGNSGAQLLQAFIKMWFYKSPKDTT